MTFLVSAIEVNAAVERTALELLNRVPGLDTDEPDAVAVPEVMTKRGKEALVLTPVSFVLTELYNLRHFSQEDRHDLPHLQISLRTSRCFIAEVVSKSNRCHRHLEFDPVRAEECFAADKTLVAGIPNELPKGRRLASR